MPRPPILYPSGRRRTRAVGGTGPIAAVVVAAVLLVAGCSQGSTATGGEGPGTDSEAFDQPITVENCGEDVTFDAPPQRIIAMNGHVGETLIELGAADRMVGTAYPDGDPAPEVAERYREIPELAEEYPTAEQILDADPDFVVGGMTSAFDEKERLGRGDLADDGIGSFLFSEYCGDGFPDIGLLTDDFTQLGELLGTQDAARDLIDRITGSLDRILDRTHGDGEEPVPTFFYDSGEDQPTTIGSGGIGALIADYAGADNLTPDESKPYYTTSWETVGERAPEAIVVFDYGSTSAEEKIEFLRNQPVMQTTPAVRDDRFIVVPLADMFESARMVTAAETIARGLHPDAFDDNPGSGD